MFGFYDSYFLFFSLKISYYGFLIALGMLLGVIIACVNAKKRGLKGDDILLLACYIIPLSILGARTYYVIFFGGLSSFWQFFKIWEGGMAIYGGIIGGAIAVALYCLIHKKNFFDVADVAVPSLALGQCIGRIGCIFAGCCYGMEVENPNLHFFPVSMFSNGAWHYATQFYESFCCLLIFIVFMILINKKVSTKGVMLSLYLICYGVTRFWIEGLRGDSLYLGSIKVSQLLSFLLIIGGTVLLTILLVRKKKKAKILSN